VAAIIDTDCNLLDSILNTPNVFRRDMKAAETVPGFGTINVPTITGVTFPTAYNIPNPVSLINNLLEDLKTGCKCSKAATAFAAFSW
jgi:hypothetical protein